MKLFTKIMLVLILLFLIGISVTEEAITSKALKTVNTYCYEIESVIKDKEDIREVDVTVLVDNMQYEWVNDESKLCYLVNHKSIQEIGYEIVKMKNYLSQNDIKEFKASLEAIRFYSEGYLHFMGANLHNVL